MNVMHNESRLDTVTEPYGEHLIAAAKSGVGPEGLRNLDLQYGRTILDVAEEVGGISERDKQLKILRRGQLFVASSLMSMEDSYPNIVAYISERVHEAQETI